MISADIDTYVVDVVNVCVMIPGCMMRTSGLMRFAEPSLARIDKLRSGETAGDFQMLQATPILYYSTY
jgi:hypothetical protein